MSDLERIKFYVKRLKDKKYRTQKAVGIALGEKEETRLSSILNGHVKAPRGLEKKLIALDPDIVKDYEEHLKTLPKESKSLSKGTPYYDVAFSGGWESGELFTTSKPAFYITSPDFERAEFACNLYGQSISRRIPNGAVIGLRKIEEWQMYFPTNELYAVVMKNDLRTVKIVKRSRDKKQLILLPDPLPEYNQTQYEPEEVDINFVSGFFQVVAWAQFEKIAM